MALVLGGVEQRQGDCMGQARPDGCHCYTLLAMARKRIITELITCDICGAEVTNPETLTLGWENDQWRLDVCKKDNATIGKTFDSWIAGAEKLPSQRVRKSARSDGNTAVIREWALSNKMKVAPRGRISTEVRQAYASAKK